MHDMQVTSTKQEQKEKMTKEQSESRLLLVNSKSKSGDHDDSALSDCINARSRVPERA